MPAFWWVELSLFPLMGRAMSGGVFWGVCELSMTLGSLSVDGWVCVPALFVVWSEVTSTGSCRQLNGVLYSDRGLLESSHRLTFPGTGNSLVVQRPRLSAPSPEAQANFQSGN